MTVTVFNKRISMVSFIYLKKHVHTQLFVIIEFKVKKSLNKFFACIDQILKVVCFFFLFFSDQSMSTKIL